jgi:predicted ATPase
LDTYILTIEQPELHVHPAMQAEMGDLFINSLNQGGPNLFVETHSEHIMLRILRRIRETSEDENPAFKIAPDDIAVYSVINDRQITDAIQIPITEDGEFLFPWPNGFFPERAKELFS